MRWSLAWQSELRMNSPRPCRLSVLQRSVPVCAHEQAACGVRGSEQHRRWGMLWTIGHAAGQRPCYYRPTCTGLCACCCACCCTDCCPAVLAAALPLCWPLHHAGCCTSCCTGCCGDCCTDCCAGCCAECSSSSQNAVLTVAAAARVSTAACACGRGHAYTSIRTHVSTYRRRHSRCGPELISLSRPYLSYFSKSCLTGGRAHTVSAYAPEIKIQYKLHLLNLSLWSVCLCSAVFVLRWPLSLVSIFLSFESPVVRQGLVQSCSRFLYSGGRWRWQRVLPAAGCRHPGRPASDRPGGRSGGVRCCVLKCTPGTALIQKCEFARVCFRWCHEVALVGLVREAGPG